MIALIVFVLTVIMLEVLRRNAAALGLVSYPGGHRHHTDPTPLVGGIGMFIGIALGVCLIPVEPETRVALSLSGVILVAVGIWDDIKEVSFAARFVAQALAVMLLASVADISLQSLGHVFATDHSMVLGRWGVALTIFAAVGVINAVNMSDGMDGLAGSLSLVTCAGLLLASFATGNLHYVPFLSVVIAALLAFMCYNVNLPGLGSARLYLGDAGSVLLGFILAWFLVALTQGPEKVMAPVTALWIFALPLFDTVAALVRRPIMGKSPFHADRRHYHHYLRDNGFSVNQTLLIAVLVAVAFAATGITAEARGVPEHVMFYAFLALFVMYVLLMLYLDFNSELENEREADSAAVLDKKGGAPGTTRS